MDEAERAREQEYFDRAQARLDASRATQAGAASAAANSAAAGWIRKRAAKMAAAFSGATEPVAFGRFDLAEQAETWYIGKRLITDDDREVLVINWQAPAAAPYHGASMHDPHGVARKRTFDCTGNRIDQFTDIFFARLRQAAADEPGAPDVPLGEYSDALLAELDRGRTAELRDIVATIQAAQYQLISAPLEQLLVIEGGPGTGKTVVALHRVSWLLFNYAAQLRAEEVLVIGPSPTFLRYAGRVLPSLGDVSVQQKDIAALAPAVLTGRVEDPALARLKGDPRLAALLDRALQARVGTPETVERLAVNGRYVDVPGDAIAAVLASARAAALPYAARRQLFREALLALVLDRLNLAAPPTRLATVDYLADRIWPQLTAATFVAELFNSRRRLAAAGAGEFSAEELSLLHRRAADRISREIWSAADLALLDEAEALINGAPPRYAHVVLDEAQDYSPMQLRSVARRSGTGSMTVVGDLAQATGDWAASSWTDVVRHLTDRGAAQVVELRHGYRVPRQIFDFAAQLLPVAAPGARPPIVVRDGPADPRVHRVSPERRAATAVEVALEHLAADRYVGLVCPVGCWAAVEAELADLASLAGEPAAGQLSMVSPREAKGLEFDAVVVVEPEEIVAEDRYGHRLLYIALTRTIRYLDVVAVGDPLPLHQPPTGPSSGPDVPVQRVPPETVDAFAVALAEQVRAAYPESMWLTVLQRAADHLDAVEADRASGRHAVPRR